MPLYNVRPLFTIVLRFHVIIPYCHILGTMPDSVLLLRNFRKTEISSAILCPTSRTCDHSTNDTMRQTSKRVS
uniref:SFRICE_032143 n=1 Tax=Spodoptera frugiperda TaxID=7108 RepID=A0A2H1WZ98_SPOFR